MKVIDSLEELKLCDLNLQLFVHALVIRTEQETETKFEGPLSESLGTTFYVVEAEEDLAHVLVVLSDASVLSIQHTAGTVDSASLLRRSLQSDKEYVYLFLATNDAGGDAYFIPRDLWSQNLLDTFKARNRENMFAEIFIREVVASNIYKAEKRAQDEAEAFDAEQRLEAELTRLKELRETRAAEEAEELRLAEERRVTLAALEAEEAATKLDQKETQSEDNPSIPD